jgi:gliding motility-associated-like protein
MASTIDNGSTDDCGGSLTFELARDFNGDGTADSSFVNNLGFDCTFTGTNNVVLRVTDAAGNSSTATATIAISDDTNPAVSTQNITVFLDNNGAASIVPLDIDNNSSDNCGIQSLSLNTTSFDCSNLGTNTVTLTATDLNGNTSTTNALVTVADNTAPEITLLGDNPLTITEGDPYNEPGATATDNCSVTISNLSITGAVDNNTVGSYTISYDINDDAGNAAATITRTVEVLEDTRPTGPAQQTFCEGATLADIEITGSNIQWYDAATGGNTLSMSTSLINGMTVYATQTINGVESTNRLEVFVTVLQPSTITASGGVTVAGNNGQIVVVDGAIVVQSPQNIDGLRVYIGGFQSGDELFINSSLPTGVSANYNTNNGVLIINGALTAQEAQTLLRSITFRTISANLTDREISFSLGSSIPFTGNGHFYEFVVDQGITWPDAFTAANNSNYYGMPGYLVTITSAAENAHVSTLLQGQGWIGASDQVVEGEWRWMNGPEAGTQFWQGNGSGSAVGGNYENWSNGEPNDRFGEDYAHFFTNGTWNDYPITLPQIAGYVVEYGGTSISCSQLNTLKTVQVIDATPPNVITQDITVNLDTNGSVTITPADIDNGSNDPSSGIASMTLDITSFDCSNIGNNTVTLTVTDNAGNFDSATAIVTVQDVLPPNALTQNITVSLDASGNASIDVTDIDNNSSDNCAIQSMSLDTTNFDCSNIGNNTVTLTVIDVNGNSNSADATVTIVDDTPPVITLVGNNPETIPLGNTYTEAGATVSDNCSVSISNLIISGVVDTSTVGTYTLTYDINDDNGNAATTVTRTVEVIDDTSPTVITQDITVDLDSNGTVSITATDIDNGSNDPGGIASMTLDISSFDCSNVGNNTVTLTVTDNSGNSDSATAIVTVQDVLPPNVLTQNITVSLDASGNASINVTDIDNNSSDNCGIQSMSLNTTSFDCSNIGDNTITLTVTDVNGNTDSADATVTIVDDIAPIIALLGNNPETVQLGGSYIEAGATVSDNCSVSLSNLNITGTVDTNTIGSYTLSYDINDDNGNAATTVTRTIEVIDDTAPTIITQDITIDLDTNGAASITAADIDNGSSDPSGIASMTLDISSFDCSNVGNNTVTLTVTDNSGNSDSATAIVTVQDVLPPNVLTQQNITVSLDASGNASINVTDIDNNSSDNCAIQSMSLDTTNFDCSTIGDNTVTLTVTDVNGNTNSADATVTVVDDIAPVITLQGNNPETVQLGDSYVELGASVSDNCSISLSNLIISGTVDSNTIGTYTLTYDINDDNGNAATTVSRTVEVIDDTAPTIITQDITIDLDTNGAASITAADIDNGSSDPSGIASMTLDISSFDCSNIGNNTVTLTVTDNSGNSDSATAIVTVQDVLPPNVLTQNITVSLDASGNASINVTDIDNNSSDNCAIQSMSLNTTAFNCSNIGNNTVTLTVIDVHGNSNSADATVSIVDDIAPVAQTQDITIQLDSNGNASITESDIDNGSTDNCSIASMTLSTYNFDCDDVGLNNVTLTITDIAGNTVDGTAVVTVENPVDAPVSNGDITECSSNPIQTITAGATVNPGDVLVWYDAAVAGNVVSNPILNTVGTITYYAEAQSAGGCSNPNRTAVTLTIEQGIDAPISNGDIEECTLDPVQTLTATVSASTGGIVEWYDAPTGGNIVTNPELNSVGSVTYYAESINSSTLCRSESRTAVTLTINATPDAPISDGDIRECVVFPAQTITASATTVANTVIEWYDAAVNGNLVTNPELSNVGSISYFAEAVDLTTGCRSDSRTEVVLTLIQEVTFNVVLDLEVCDDNTNDGIAPFDLTEQNNNISSNGTISPLNISYHTSLNEAENQINPLPFYYNSTTTTLYARIENNLTGCYVVESFNVIVLPSPQNSFPEQILECDDDIVSITPGNGFNSYLWSNGQTTESIDVTQTGVYDVRVTNNAGCEATFSFDVLISEPPVNVNIIIDEGSMTNNSIIIRTQGIGNYEYSIDGFNFQSSPEFNHVEAGTYEVIVRDINGCDSYTEVINIIGIPDYFTPNQDGYHDYWKPVALDIYPDAQIFIFDRYGKLLKQVSADGIGWDGTFNGQPLPSSDYWYQIDLGSGAVLKGHFTLKR